MFPLFVGKNYVLPPNSGVPLAVINDTFFTPIGPFLFLECASMRGGVFYCPV